jgi:hypothetical protein
MSRRTSNQNRRQRESDGHALREQRIVNPETPPALQSLWVVPFRIRYKASTASLSTVYWRSLANLLIVAFSTTQGYVPYVWIKPKYVELRGPAASLDAATGFSYPKISCTMYYKPLAEGQTQPMSAWKTQADTATNDRGSYVKVRFPLDKTEKLDCYGVTSLTNSPVAFQTAQPIGAVLDLVGTMQLFPDYRTTFPKVSSTSGATAGAPYYNSLDNLNATGSFGTVIWVADSPMAALSVGLNWL